MSPEVMETRLCMCVHRCEWVSDMYTTMCLFGPTETLDCNHVAQWVCKMVLQPQCGNYGWLKVTITLYSWVTYRHTHTHICTFSFSSASDYSYKEDAKIFHYSSLTRKYLCTYHYRISRLWVLIFLNTIGVYKSVAFAASITSQHSCMIILYI